MRHLLDKDMVAAAAQKTLVMMTQRNIPFYLENYLVWFGHFLGANAALDEDIDSIIKKGRQFSEEVYLDLFAKHFGKDARNQSGPDSPKEIQKILRSVLDEILHTQDFTSEYRDKLTLFTAQIEDAGGLDEVHKVVADLMRATVTAIQASERLKDHLAETTLKYEELERKLGEAQQEILVDPLTLLNNRRAFDRKILTYLEGFQKQGAVFCVLMMDIDSFKQFNDQCGHLMGDKVLKFLGTLLSKEIKGKDFVARFGGEEFVILLGGASLEKACLAAESIRKSLDGVQLKFVKTGQVLGKITISTGVAAARKGDTEASLIKRADDALYLAKRSGRNNIKSERDLSGLDRSAEITSSASMVEILKP